MGKILLAASIALLTVTSLQAQDTVSTTTVAPTANLVASQPVGGSQYLVDVARDPGQGQTFSLPNDFTIEALTVQIGTDTRGGQGVMEDAAALSLNVYQLPLDPVTGDPILTLDSTTLLGSFNDPTAAPFDATAPIAIDSPLYVTFDLSPASTAALGTLSANTLYAFTITTSSTANPNFRIERSALDEFVDGNGIFTGGNNVPTLRAVDDAVFFLEGTADGEDCLLGDVNMDEIVNFLDISPFITELAAGGSTLCQADCNEDGEVSFLDIAPFITILANQ